MSFEELLGFLTNLSGGNMKTLNRGNEWISLSLYVIQPLLDYGELQETARVTGINKIRAIKEVR